MGGIGYCPHTFLSTIAQSEIFSNFPVNSPLTHMLSDSVIIYSYLRIFWVDCDGFTTPNHSRQKHTPCDVFPRSHQGPSRRCTTSCRRALEARSFSHPSACVSVVSRS